MKHVTYKSLKLQLHWGDKKKFDWCSFKYVFLLHPLLLQCFNGTWLFFYHSSLGIHMYSFLRALPFWLYEPESSFAFSFADSLEIQFKFVLNSNENQAIVFFYSTRSSVKTWCLHYPQCHLTADSFIFKLVFIPNQHWLKWHHLRTFIRLHTAPFGDTKDFIQLFFTYAVLPNSWKQTLMLKAGGIYDVLIKDLAKSSASIYIWLVYDIICNSCREHYINETARILEKRLNEHRKQATKSSTRKRCTAGERLREPLQHWRPKKVPYAE